MPASDYFYYVDTTGYCTNGAFVLATGWKEHCAKVCAWKSSLPNVAYGCNGDNGICWTSPSACNNTLETGNLTMGNGLQSCVRPSGSHWCCRDEPQEKCGEIQSEPFICFKPDLEKDNPMRKISVNVAVIPASASSVLSTLGLIISSPPPTLTPFSNETAATPRRDGSSLSVGEIAGISVEIFIALALVILGAVFVLRHRKQRLNELKEDGTKPGNPQSEAKAMNSPVKELSSAAAMHELSDLTCTGLSPQDGAWHEQRHELHS